MEQEFTEFSKFRESDKFLNYELARCMDPLCCLCHAGAVVGSYTIGGWVTGSSPFNDKYVFTQIRKFSENI